MRAGTPIEWFAFLVLASVLFCSCYSIDVNSPSTRTKNEETRAAVVPLIEALDKFITDTGRIPEEVDEIIPKYIDKMPKAPKDYSYQAHGKYYLISFLDPMKKYSWNQYHVYWSKTKEWVVSDFTEWPEE
jgi:hypothetical protein